MQKCVFAAIGFFSLITSFQPQDTAARRDGQNSESSLNSEVRLPPVPEGFAPASIDADLPPLTADIGTLPEKPRSIFPQEGLNRLHPAVASNLDGLVVVPRKADHKWAWHVERVNRGAPINATVKYIGDAVGL